MYEKPLKPLGRKAYGSIGHLPGSRLGTGDHHCHVGQDAICTLKARDKHDRIIVTEKLDGSNVAAAKIEGKIWALQRAGYPADSSPHRQHHLFAAWVQQNHNRFMALLDEGEAAHAEWLALAHGTRYVLHHEPFVVFDITRNAKRVIHDEMTERSARYDFTTAKVLSDGPPISIADALAKLGPFGHHGALEDVEGIVYRVERKGVFDFLAKYVRSDKVDGKYLSDITGCDPIWHWTPPES